MLVTLLVLAHSSSKTVFVATFPACIARLGKWFSKTVELLIRVGKIFTSWSAARILVVQIAIGILAIHIGKLILISIAIRGSLIVNVLTVGSQVTIPLLAALIAELTLFIGSTAGRSGNMTKWNQSDTSGNTADAYNEAAKRDQIDKAVKLDYPRNEEAPARYPVRYPTR